MPAPAFTLRAAPLAGGSRITVEGTLSLTDGRALWRELGRALAALPPGASCELELSGVVRVDGGAAALVASLLESTQQRGVQIEVAGARHEPARLLALYACRPGETCERSAPRAPGVLTEVGDYVFQGWIALRTTLQFVGDLTAGVIQAVRRPRSVHFGDFLLLLERAGSDGVPIVLLINFLVGAILGLQGAIQLHRFGGDQFLANLVGLSIVRELGPLMTAILVTGRSGAAYAAELGTMTVNEEVDALRTLGQDPQRFLVFPRVLALLVVVPLLTLLGDVIGTLGGLAIAVGYLDQPAVVYLQSLETAVDLGDVGTGLLKSVFFAAALGLIACQRGLSTRGGAAGVGRATTSAVVVVLFALVLLDAVFTYVFSLLDW